MKSPMPHSTLWKRIFANRLATIGLLVLAVMVLLTLPFGAPVTTSRATPTNPIYVTDLTQKISSTGGCSLPEAIYSSEYHNNIAPEPANPGNFIPTTCEKGTGDDTIVLPAGAVFLMSSI